jgi:hypothetical protein
MSTIFASLPVKYITATTYTTSDDDNGFVIVHTSASSTTVTLHAAAPPGFNCSFVQNGAGVITFAAGSGGTLQSRGAKTKTAGQYAIATAFAKSNAGAAAIFNLQGDITT